jgi:hypothetical protein
MGNCLNLIEAAHVQLVTAAYDVYRQVCVTNPESILGFFHVHDPNASAFR